MRQSARNGLRSVAAGACTVALGAAIVGLLVLSGSRERPARPLRDLGRSLAAGEAGDRSLVSEAELLARTPDDRRTIFWHMLAGREEPLPPTSLFELIRGARTPRDRALRVEYAAGRILQSGRTCPVPLGWALAELVPELPPSVQAKALRTIARSRYRGAAEAALHILEAGATGEEARLEAFRLLSVHGDAGHIPRLQALWKAAPDREKAAALQALRCVAPVREDGEPLPEPPPGRSGARALADRDPLVREAALRRLSLFWEDGAREPVERVLREGGLSAEAARCALAALGLSGEREAGDAILLSLESAPDLRTRTAAVDALRAFAGRDFQHPGPEELYDPSVSVAAHVRARLAAVAEGDLPSSLLESAGTGCAAALDAMTARAEAGLLGGERGGAGAPFRELLGRLSTLPERARPHVAYAAGYALRREDLDLMLHALRSASDGSTRGAALWAVTQLTGGNDLAPLVGVLLSIDPAAALAEDVCRHLLASCPARPPLEPGAVVAALPDPRALQVEAQLRWRVALALRHFRSREAESRLLTLAADPAARVRAAAVYSASVLAAAVPPPAAGSLSSAEARTLVASLLGGSLKGGEHRAENK